MLEQIVRLSRFVPNQRISLTLLAILFLITGYQNCSSSGGFESKPSVLGDGGNNDDIRDDDKDGDVGNVPPVVSLSSPANGSTATAPTER